MRGAYNMNINDDTVTFTLNSDTDEWEYDLGGTIYSFDTLLEAMTSYNYERFEA